MRILSIIPARGGSKRIPQKNIKNFLGHPLIHWSIRFAQNYGRFDRVAVSTDSEAIAKCCADAGMTIDYMRPPLLATDTATSVDVALDALDRAEADGGIYDAVALLQPTSPVRETSRWDLALRMLDQEGCDAVVGVSPTRDHPFQVLRCSANLALSPWGDGGGLALRSQDLPPAVVVNGALYLVRTPVLRTEKTFFPRRTFGVLCDQPFESVDIDTEADWVVAETLAQYYGRTP